MAAAWYVIQIVPQLQHIAEVNLKRQSFTHFFPRLATRVTPNGRVLETAPLFRGYGFVQLDLTTDRWSPIKYTRGVLRILPQSSQTPTPIDTSFVDFLLANSPIVREDKLTELLQDYLPGARVRIVRGVLEGYYGTIVIQRGRLFEVLLTKSRHHLRNPLVKAEDLTLL